jgi:hypothetical protein
MLGLPFENKDEGNTLLRNVGNLPPNYTALQPVILWCVDFDSRRSTSLLETVCGGIACGFAGFCRV